MYIAWVRYIGRYQWYCQPHPILLFLSLSKFVAGTNCCLFRGLYVLPTPGPTNRNENGRVDRDGRTRAANSTKIIVSTVSEAKNLI